MQTNVTIHVFQDERPMAADNTSLGEFVLSGLPLAPRGVPKIEVTFDIDANGILEVAAKDMATGTSQSIRITGSTRLADADKQRMVNEAERYTAEDRARRDTAEQLNAADAVCYQAEKMLADFADKLSSDLRQRLEDAARAVREALRQHDAALATQRAEALKRVIQEAGTTQYGQAAHGETPSAGPTSPGHEAAQPTGAAPHGRVVDAEYHATTPR